jgi:hypothetical protein
MIGTTLSLEQQQTGLRYSYIAWIVWLGVVIPLWQSQWIGMADAWALAAIAVAPLLVMLAWIWPAKNGNMLMLIGMIFFVYFGFAILAAMRGGWATLVYGMEALLITHTLFWLMWVVERMPKLQQGG